MITLNGACLTIDTPKDRQPTIIALSDVANRRPTARLTSAKRGSAATRAALVSGAWRRRRGRARARGFIDNLARAGGASPAPLMPGEPATRINIRVQLRRVTSANRRVRPPARSFRTRFHSVGAAVCFLDAKAAGAEARCRAIRFHSFSLRCAGSRVAVRCWLAEDRSGDECAAMTVHLENAENSRFRKYAQQSEGK